MTRLKSVLFFSECAKCWVLVAFSFSRFADQRPRPTNQARVAKKLQFKDLKVVIERYFVGYWRENGNAFAIIERCPEKIDCWQFLPFYCTTGAALRAQIHPHRSSVVDNPQICLQRHLQTRQAFNSCLNISKFNLWAQSPIDVINLTHLWETSPTFGRKTQKNITRQRKRIPRRRTWAKED